MLKINTDIYGGSTKTFSPVAEYNLDVQLSINAEDMLLLMETFGGGGVRGLISCEKATIEKTTSRTAKQETNVQVLCIC